MQTHNVIGQSNFREKTLIASSTNIEKAVNDVPFCILLTEGKTSKISYNEVYLVPTHIKDFTIKIDKHLRYILSLLYVHLYSLRCFGAFRARKEVGNV